MSDTPSYDPTPQPSSSSKGLPPALANLSDSTLLWVQVGGGLLAFIGVFLPWATAKATFFGATFSESANGFDDGLWGFLVLVLSLAVAALAFIKVRNMQIQALEKVPPTAPLILTGVLALIALFRWIYILSDGAGDFGEAEAFGLEVSSGVGIWFVLLGSLAALGGALLPVLKARRG